MQSSRTTGRRNFKNRFFEGKSTQLMPRLCHKANEIIPDTYLNMMRQTAKVEQEVVPQPEYAVPNDLCHKNYLISNIATTVIDTES